MQYAAWAEQHPERDALVKETWAAIDRGDVDRPTCQLHDRPAHPAYDWDALVVVGWRCRSGHWL